MGRTPTEIQEGSRLAVTAEFITRRVIGRGDAPVHRLLVADRDGAQVTVLTTPERSPPLGLQAGAAYRFVGLLGADPTVADSTEGRCGSCGGPLRPGGPLDTVDPAVGEAASQLGLEQPFGVLDAAATVRSVPAPDTPVDDWVPMAPQPPERVCMSCGRHVGGDDTPASRIRGPVTDQRTEGRGPPEHPVSRPASARTYRAAVARGYTPRPAALADGQLFAGHRFAVPGGQTSGGLFAPGYGAASSEHPLAGERERYLAVALDSTVPAGAFERPPLDLVVVLDRPGSMTRPLGPAGDRTKLDAAKRGLCALTEHLRSDDRFGIVLGAPGQSAHVAKPLRAVDGTDCSAIRGHVRDLEAVPGAALAGGVETAVELLASADGDGREQRLLILSDLLAHPGTGALTERLASAATDGVHATLVPVGFDADAALARRLSTVRGGNHILAHSGAAFERRLDGAFDRLMRPAVHDLTVELDTDSLGVERVHAAPSGERVSDQLVHVGTVFPRADGDRSLLAGFVLLRVVGAADTADLTVSWTEPGGEYTDSVTLGFDTDAAALQPAVALARCGRELRAWAADRHAAADSTAGTTPADGAMLPVGPDTEPVSLAVSNRRARRFDRFRAALAEHDRLAEGLRQELSLLDSLAALGDHTA